jgi:hypothetical protein
MRLKTTEIVSLTVAGLAFAGSLTSAFYTYTNRNRELDIKLVELGIGVLRADPKDTGLTAARGWAIQVIENNSNVKFSDDDRKSLLEKPLLYRSTTGLPTRRETLEKVPDSEVNNVVKGFEREGAIVQKTRQADGTWTVVAAFPN